MLGWEFPPFVTGGLGTACHGLTRAMDRRGIRVTFVLPRSIGQGASTHVNLLEPSAVAGDAPTESAPHPQTDRTASLTGPTPDFEQMRFLNVPAGFTSPYQRTAGQKPVGVSETVPGQPGIETDPVLAEIMPELSGEPPASWLMGGDYGGDLIEQVARYAHLCVYASRQVEFDVIHAHDWMTYPAGLQVARATGKPLIVHVHSTEFDRTAGHANQRIYDIERRGMHGAMGVVAVSQLTKDTVVHRYGMPSNKVDVVYNGVEIEPTNVGLTGIQSRDKIVLYFGRITIQKGPEYFIRAAKRVLEVMEDVKFVVAGSGDMARTMIEMAAEMGIGHKVVFTGFLRGDDIKRVFALADLYVMPSVTEPFGIAPLEAMGHDVPVIISKSSGVSEVLTHALKVDFWDIDSIADKIIAVLRHPPLSRTLREHGQMEIRRLTWEGAASRCEQIYDNAIAQMTGTLPILI